jgi:serine protease Do
VGLDLHIPRDLQSFVREYPGLQESDATLGAMCRRLCKAGYLAYAGQSHAGRPGLLGIYMAPLGYDVQLAEYGVYDFVARGFPEIRQHFLPAVLPLLVVTVDDQTAIGTGFLLEDHRLVTARHCIERMQEVTIPGWNPELVPLERIWVSSNVHCDLAVLQFASDPFPERAGFQLARAHVLDEVLTMGYPPIAGFDSVQVAERAQVAGYLHSSVGAVSAAEPSYLMGDDCLLITARVKGGSSGGPVVNGEGRVVAIVSGIPRDIEKSDRLDTLGYAVATDSSVLDPLLSTTQGAATAAVMLRFEEIMNGFRTACAD